MRRRRSSQRGVTLIELLIAVTLMALLSTGMLMAIQLGLSTMGRINDRLYSNRRVMSVNRIIDSQIANMVFAKAQCSGGGGSSAPPPPGGGVTFFQGEEQTMRFVSSFSLEDAARGYPTILEFQVIPGENEGVRLIVNEHIYAGPVSTGSFCLGMRPSPLTGQPIPLFVPVQTGSNSFVLADHLAVCRMSYRETLQDPPFERWVPMWGKDILPSAIRIEMVPLPTAQLRLPLVTIVAPVHVTRDPRIQYDAN
ncbi:MAG TPA: type II secretion system protein [Bryobacteraceae bacterium]|jgi:prepilin-type N-terminal cleavage/methylation domain-containing protein